MYTIDDIKVTLLNKEEVQNFIKKLGEIATVCYNTNEKYSEKVGESCLESGHLSGSRGDYFKFEIECPRYTADQIMRHEVGVFKNCQSQRFVSNEKVELYISPRLLMDASSRYKMKQYEITVNIYYKDLVNECKELKFDDKTTNDYVRTMLPIGVKTKLRIGFTLEGLINFMNKRLCARADEPIRRVALLMKNQVIDIEPRYEKFLVPMCERMLFCSEKESCGYKPKKEDLEKIYKEYYNYKE